MMDNKVYIERTFPCNAEVLFNWLVQPELIIQWFGPPNMEKIKAVVDARVGGKFEITLRNTSKEPFIVEGQYSEITPPTTIEFKMAYRGVSESQSTVKIIVNSISLSSCHLRLIQAFDLEPKSMDGRTDAWYAMMELLASKLSS